MNKKGFTLVELSIVLVIIGLLIGGILAAQSMIGTAKIQGLVRQVGQFDAAVENFQTKYQQLPGDTNLMGDDKASSNNDGLIFSASNQYFTQELGKFWSDLSHSGFLNENGQAYQDHSTGGTPADNTFVPQAKAGKNALVFVAGSPTTKNDYYIFSQYTSTNFVFSLAGAFYTSEIVALDQKMDDGLPTTGNVQPWGYLGVGIYNFGNNTGTDYLEVTESNCDPDPALKYLVSDTTDLCSIRIRVGTSSGNVK